jgi:hypothetical protein
MTTLKSAANWDRMIHALIYLSATIFILIRN